MSCPRGVERLRCLAFFGRVVIWGYGLAQPLFCHGCLLTVKLTHWLSHSAIFGPHDKIVQDLTEAWCIAKIRRLVGSMKAPVDPRYEDEFALAEYLETSSFRHQDDSSERPFMSVGTLREELEKLSAPKVSPELLDFIEFLLVLEHTKRPSAVEALQHPYLR